MVQDQTCKSSCACSVSNRPKRARERACSQAHRKPGKALEVLQVIPKASRLVFLKGFVRWRSGSVAEKGTRGAVYRGVRSWAPSQVSSAALYDQRCLNLRMT